jgi:hypothetical protein
MPDAHAGKANSNLFSSSFLRPATNVPPKKHTGFGFMKFPAAKAASESSGKGALPAFASTKPLLGNFSGNGLAKKSSMTSENTGKDALPKPQGKGTLPFGFRADTKASNAKKRKAAESFTDEEKRNPFPGKTARANSFALKASTCNKVARKEPVASGASAQRDSIRSRPLFAPKVVDFGVKANDRAALKKRGLLLTSTDSGPSLKRCKTMPQIGTRRVMR